MASATSTPEPAKPALASPAPANTPALSSAPPADTSIETPEATLGGQAWLKQLDAGSFIVQHGTANTYQSMLDIQRKYPSLKDAHIVAAYRPGEKLAHFVMVTGPFTDVSQGYEAAKRPGSPRSWVRPTRSLQVQLKNPA